MVEVDISSDYINSETHKPLGVNELIVLEEFKPMPTDYGPKYTGKVQTNGSKPEQKLYQMNNTSAKVVAKIFGKDTLSWIGKKLSIIYSPTNISGEMKDVVYVHEQQTRDLNPVTVGSQTTVTPPPTTTTETAQASQS